MASLDQAVGHDDQVNKPDSDCRQVQEGLLWSRDWQTLAKRGLCRLVAVVRANSLANQAPKGRRQSHMGSAVGRRGCAPQLGGCVMADVRTARHKSDDGLCPQSRGDEDFTATQVSQKIL